MAETLVRTRAFLAHSWPLEMLPEVEACEREVNATRERVRVLEEAGRKWLATLDDFREKNLGIPNQELDECDTIQEVLHEFGWDAVVDPGSGDITGLEYMGDKLLDEERLFAAISPVVEKGSFVQVKSDDGGRWRWSFDGKHCSAPLEAGRQMVRERIRAGERQLGG
jgi:hypothetical protein